MNSVFQNGGIYIVIGGAGGVGEVFSEYVARTYQAHVVWLGRRARDGEIDAKIARIAALGPAPEYIQADAADFGSLHGAYEAIKARYPRINGLIHSAIVLQDQSVALMSLERMQASLAAKLDVSVRMAQVFGREALDFVLFFSSFQSFAKAPGQSNYAAGCTFKDAFAHQLRRAWSCRVKIVNWGFWGSVGVVASEAMRTRMAKIGLASIEAPEAMQAVESLLAGPRDQIVLLKTQSSTPLLPGPPRAGTLTWLPIEGAAVELPAVEIRTAVDALALPVLPVSQEAAEALVDAAVAVMFCQLQSIGLFKGAQASHNLAAKYERWLEESTRILLERGWLRRTGTVIHPREMLDQQQAWASWRACVANVVAATGREGDLALVDATLRELPAILTGRKLATDVLFPNSSLTQVTGVYHENPQTTYYNEAMAQSLIALLRNKLAAQPGYRFRMFEVGAGTGGTSAALFKHLAPYAASIDTYVYTDISKAFLLHADASFRAGAPYLATQLFNVERPLAEQGLRAGSFDIVIAANVLHATRNIHRTVHNCKALLKRGGVLLLNEMAMNTLFSHLTFGLLEGWWLYEDPQLRISGCPGLTPSTWARLLEESGFSPVLFPCEHAHERGQAVIVAQSDGLVRPLASIRTLAGANAEALEKRTPSEAAVTGRRSLARAASFDTAHAVALSQDSQPQTQMARERVAQLITEQISISLKVPLKSIEPHAPFADYGVDSITGVQIVHSLNRELAIELETTTLFDHPTIDKLADHIVTSFSTANISRAGAPALRIVQSETTAPANDNCAPEPSAAVQMNHPPAAARAPVPIAIVGMSGRFAGSDSLDAFWQHLANGDDLVQVVSRWDLPKYDSGFATGQKGYCRHGSFLTDVDLFDAAFFNISAVEARFMDPQQRLFLEEAWKALEDAGYAGAGMEGARCGVYVGAGPGDYAQLMQSAGPPQAFWGNATSVLASRIAYYLDLKGPAVAIDTACSSSLVALHLACQSLWLAETDIALAGGVFVQSTPNFYLLAGRSGMLSASGRCHTFDARADGFVPGEGVGVVVLRRLADALADGDHIHGVIRGTGINQDGATNGITAPSAQSQEQLERSIYDSFSIDPAGIQMVEAHGTGTELGDPIEFQALTRAFRGYTQANGFCAIGSVKSNIGHAAPAAGMAGLFKVLLAMRARQMPPSLHFETCNGAIQLEASPFYVNTQLREWPAPTANPRMAALSSFGFSGTNAHVVIEEAPPQERRHVSKPAYLIVLSARNEMQLRDQVERLLKFCETQSRVDAGDLSFTLLLGRRSLEHRLAAIVTDTQDLVSRLSKWCKVGQVPQVYAGQAGETRRQQQAALKRYGNQCLFECSRDPASTGYVERLAVIAELFVQGYQLDFRLLFQNDSFKRLPLPVYPFDRQRHWIEERRDATLAQPLPASGRHPLLQRNASTLYETAFASCFTGDEPFLRDHQIQGRRILPGVAHLEMIHAAICEAAPEAAGVQLLNVHWLRPAEVSHGKLSLSLHLRPKSETEIDYDISAGEGGAVVYSQGQVRLSAQRTAAPQMDLQDVLSKCRLGRLSKDTIYGTFSQLGFAYGPAHQSIQTLHIGQDARRNRDVVAELEVPAIPGTESEAFHLHPSLLDGALQACMGLHVPLENDPGVDRGRGPEVPFALERLEIYAQCPPKAWAWVRVREGSGPDSSVRKLDVSLCDDTGRVCVEFRGFAWRALAPVQSGSPTRDQLSKHCALLLAPSWENSEPATEQTDVAAFEDGNHWVLLVGTFPQWAHTELQQHLIEAHCEQISADVAQRGPFYEGVAVGAFELVQRILLGKPKRPTLLQVVIAPDTEGQYGLPGVSALLKTASQENSLLITQCIELRSELAMDALGDLLRRDARATTDQDIRYRQGRREVRSLRQVSVVTHPANPLEQPVPWRDQGVYLITGGLGGLGLIFARSIAARTQQATLILVGRSAPDAQQNAVLSELRASGSRVEYRRVDITDAAAVRELIAHISQEYGRLTGILHSAGVIRDSYIVHKKLHDMQQVLAPKVSGLINLDEASRDLHLEMFVLLSSVVGVIGNPGQADYAAANGFMDAYSKHRNRLVALGRRKGRTLSINWPLWEQGGMQVHASVISQLRAQGMVPMTTDHGVEVLAHCIQSAAFDSQVTVFVRDGEELRNAAAPERAKAITPAPPAHKSSVASVRELLSRVQALLLEMVQELLQVPPGEVDLHKQLSEYGFDSINFTQLGTRLQERCGVSLSPTIFFEHSTLGSFAAYLAETHADTLSTALSIERADASAGDAVASATDAFAAPVARSEVIAPASRSFKPATLSERRPTSIRPAAQRAELAFEPIAIIGMSGSFPQAPDIDSLWQVLKEGRDCITEIPPDRWDWRALYGEPGEQGFKTNVKWGGFVDAVKMFDPMFFGIHTREAELMDPQRRLLLTHSWQLLEDAGYAPSSLSGSLTAVFAGTGDVGWGTLALSGGATEGFATTGLSSSIGPNRVSFQLNFHGPSEAIDTACSSSLVAIHRAVNTLRAGQCDLAIAGGVNVIVTPMGHVGFSRMGMLSPEGRCKTFSADANGYVRSEGAGLLLLKRLREAEADGDHIHGVILHTGENHGGRATSPTAPNAKAQSDLVRSVYEESRIDPRTITYIEAHGTGTRLGDPVEINGLKSAFNALYAQTPDSTALVPQCGLGSVKSNIGHLELASGVAAAIKVLLQMKHRTLVRTLHCEKLNPLIELTDSPFYILDRERAWEVPCDRDGKPIARRAGISSFGVGGVNAHVVLEEYSNVSEEPLVEAEISGPRLIVLSARTESQLQQQARNLLTAVHQRGYTDRDLTRIAYTLQVGRDAMSERLALLAPDMRGLVAGLQGFLEGKALPARVYRGQVKTRKNALSLFKENDELQEAVSKWVQRRRYDLLLELWVQGLEFDWRSLYGANPPRRISLPTYPFSQQSYWIQPPKQATQPPAESGARATSLHPLLHQNSSTLHETRFSSIFSGQEFFLRDHVVQGRKILPGVGHLEMARAALSRAVGENASYELRDMMWLRPLALEGASVPVDIVLRAESDQVIQIQIREGNGEQQVFSRARAQQLVTTTAAPVDLARLQEICTHAPLTSEEIYRIFSTAGLAYGPGFRTIETLRVGSHDGKPHALARLKLPEAETLAQEDLIHPGLLDGALQAVLGLSLAHVGRSTKLSLPFALQAFRTYAGGCPARVWAWLRLSGDNGSADSLRKVDITLLDDTGRVCVELLGLSLRETAAPSANVQPPTYQMSQQHSSQQSYAQQVAAQEEQTVRLTQRWRASEIESHTRSPSIHGAMDRCVLLVEGFDETDAQAVRESLAGTVSGARVDCLVLRANPPELADRYHDYTLAMLHALRGLLKSESARPVFVQLVVSAGSAELTHCIAGLAALLKTAGAENPRLLGQCITLDGPLAGSSLAGMLEANATRSKDQEVRYLEGRREVREIVELSTSEQVLGANGPWREDGVYLITGGLGGLGLVFAREILRSTRARVMLCGRSAMDETKQKLLESLQQRGVAEYWPVDVANRSAVDALIDSIQRRHGTLTGIIHSAGVILDKYIVNKSDEDVRHVLSAKVVGVVNMDEASAAVPLDFFVAFSSVAGVLGNAGQADYAAANAFMDRYLERRHALVMAGKRAGKSLSVNWPLWAEGGMNVTTAMRALFERNYGIVPLPTDAGLRELYRGLIGSEAQVIVIHGRAKRALPSAAGSNSRKEESPSLTSAQQSEQVTVLVCQALAKWLKVKVEDVDPTADFTDLGFDSVSLTEFSLWLNSEYQLSLSPAIFLDHPGIPAFCEHLVKQHADKFLPGAQAGTPAPSVISQPPSFVSAPTTAPTESLNSLQPMRGDDVTSGPAASEPVSAQQIEQVTAVVCQALAKWLKVKVDDIDPAADFADLGFDSVSLTELSLWLNSEYELTLSPASFVDHRGIPSFCEYLATHYAPKLVRVSQVATSAPAAAVRQTEAASVLPEFSAASSKVQPDDQAVNEMQQRHAEAFLERQRLAFASAEQVRHCLLQTSQGLGLEVTTAGRGRTVLLLPPFGVLANAWMQQVTELSKRYRVVTLNYPGCGRSEYASRFASLEAIAQQVLDCLDVLGCDTCDVVGWSMGASVAQLMAAAQPDRTRTLTLVNTVTRSMSDLSVAEAAQIFGRAYADFADNAPAAIAERQASRAGRFEFFKASYVPEVLSSYAQGLLKFDFRRTLDRLAESRALIVAGGNDPWSSPESTQWMQQQIRRAQHFELAHAGHCIPLRDCDWFNSKLLHFLEND